MERESRLESVLRSLGIVAVGIFSLGLAAIFGPMLVGAQDIQFADPTVRIEVNNGTPPEMLRLIASEPITSVTGKKIVADWWDASKPNNVNVSRVVFGPDEGGQNIRWSGALPPGPLPMRFIICIRAGEFQDAATNKNTEMQQTFQRSIKEDNDG